VLGVFYEDPFDAVCWYRAGLDSDHLQQDLAARGQNLGTLLIT